MDKIPRTQPWHKRTPSWKRLTAFTLVAGTLGAGTLALGQFYCKNVVPGVVAGGGSLWPRLPGVPKPPPGNLAFRDKERMNILLLGIDYNYTDKGILYTKDARSDTMMVVSLSKGGKFLNMVSVPRDTQVLINDKVGFDKINGAYAVGGAPQAMRTVSRFLGTDIDHYVVVKVYGARKIFDALGGLPIDVEKDMDYDDNWGHFHVHLKKGIQKLNADQAVGYARFRMDAEGDRGRMRRQQQVIQTLVAQLKNPSIVGKLPGLIKAVTQTLETDMNPPQIMDLAMLYKSFDRKRIHSAQIVGGDAMINGQAMLIPFKTENEKTVRALLKDDTDLALQEIRIEVLNGTHQGGTARRTADEMSGTGFNVTRVADADNGDYVATEIIEHVRNARIHGRLAGMFPGATFKMLKDAKAQCDYVITVGTDHTPLATAPSRTFNPDGTGPGANPEIARQPAEPAVAASSSRSTRAPRNEPRQEVEPSAPASPANQEGRGAPPALENPLPAPVRTDMPAQAVGVPASQPAGAGSTPAIETAPATVPAATPVP